VAGQTKIKYAERPWSPARPQPRGQAPENRRRPEKSTVTRTKPAEQRRAELLEAARALFLAKGVAATSLDDITQRAGVSKGLFYLYFPSKEDLVLALQEQFSGEVAARMAAAAAAQAKVGPADWPARLDACVRAGFECYRELHDLHEVLFHHAHPVRSDPPLATLVIRDLLAAGVAAGALDLSDPESTAVLCYASMHAFDLRGHGGPDDARLIRAAQQLVRRAAGLP
jgi:TetR/AcrR family transcriptional regulator, transcriptional repressor for nem operon